MDNHKRMFRLILLATLGIAGDASAYSEEDAYDLPRIRAIFPPPEDVYGAGGGGGYFGAASTFDDNAYSYERDLFPEPEAPTCEQLAGSAPEGCDVTRPPELATNGCGGGPTAGIVPDSLVIASGNQISMGFPGLYTDACNRHDTCYGTHPGDKRACDDALVSNMINAARDAIPPIVWQRYGAGIMDQINGYGAFFRSSIGTQVSMVFFNGAQEEDICRNYSDAVRMYCGSFQ